MGDIEHIRKRVDQIKKEFGYSNDELGQICGVSYTAIGNIINGITKDPGVTLFIKISNHLGININWLLFGIGEIYGDNKNSVEKGGDENKYLIQENEHLKQENEHLREIINSKEEQIEVFKKMVRILEDQFKVYPKQA